jgi:enolase
MLFAHDVMLSGSSQEFMILPTGAKTFKEAMQIGAEVCKHCISSNFLINSHCYMCYMQ